MSEIKRPDLMTAEVGEVAEWLIYEQGWAPETVLVWRNPDDNVLHIRSEGVDEEAINAAMTDYVPIAAPGGWVAKLPPDAPLIDGHVEHVLMLARATPEQLASLTQAELRHAVRDLARAFVAYVKSDWENR